MTKKVRLKNLVWKQNPSRPSGKHIELQFNADFMMSIVDDGYGKEQGLYELGVFYKGEMREVYHVTNKGDTVAGFLNEKELEHRIDLLAHYTRSVPVQINKWSN